jgi:hypothetical protein
LTEKSSTTLVSDKFEEDAPETDKEADPSGSYSRSSFASSKKNQEKSVPLRRNAGLRREKSLMHLQK